MCIAGETGLVYFKKYIYIYLYIVDSRILWLNRFASIHPGQFKQTQGLVTAKSAWYTVGIFKFNWTINITVFRAYIYFTLQYGHKKKVNGTIGNSYVIATQSLKCEGLHHQIAKYTDYKMWVWWKLSSFYAKLLI